MKSHCNWFVMIMFAILAGMVEGGSGYCPKMGENKQSTVSAKQSPDSFGNVYKEKGAWTWAGDRNKVYAQLEVSVPKVDLTLFNESYSVGGEDVCIRVQLVDDDYFATEGTRGGWHADDAEIKIRKSDYSEIMKNGASATFKSEGDLWKTLRHEAVHASFSQKYPALKNTNPGLNSFVTEMLAYVGGTGLDERTAVTHIAKHYPIAKVTAEKYLAELDKGQCERPMKIFGNGKTISVDDLKKMDLDDKSGDWCKCEDPGCCNTFRVIRGKHFGGIRFFCSKCGRVNVEFAKEAIKYERIIKDEGGTPQWQGPNAEAMANKAAGNAK